MFGAENIDLLEGAESNSPAWRSPLTRRSTIPWDDDGDESALSVKDLDRNVMRSSLALPLIDSSLIAVFDQPTDQSADGDAVVTTEIDDEAQERKTFLSLCASGHRLRMAAFAGVKDSLLTTKHIDHIRQADQFFSLHAAEIGATLRADTRSNFLSLISALRDEDEDREINIESLRSAIKFLATAALKTAPSFAITEDGEFYLQWYNGKLGAVTGAKFKSSMTVIWSIAGKTSAAGSCLPSDLEDELRAHAYWMFFEQ